MRTAALRTMLVVAGALVVGACSTAPAGLEGHAAAGSAEGAPAASDAASAERLVRSTAYGRSLHDAVRSGRLESWLSENGGIRAADAGGQTPLHYAVRLEDPQLVQTFLEFGLGPNAQDADGYGPLHWAAALSGGPSGELIDMLVRAGADPNRASAGGLTPLHAAVFADNWSATDRLLFHGSSIELRTDRGLRPYDYDTEAGARLRARIAGMPELDADLQPYYLRFGREVLPFVERYGPSAAEAYYERGMRAFTAGTRPAGPPNAVARAYVSQTFEYLETPRIEVEVQNQGEGAVYELIGRVTARPGTVSSESRQVYFGYLAPGETAVREVLLERPGLALEGEDIDLTVEFSEANEYVPYPDPLQARIRINPLDDRTVLRSPELFGVEEIRRLAEEGRIGRYAVDRLLHQGIKDFSMDDVRFFAVREAISQDVIEHALLEGEMPFTGADIVRLAELDYVSRSTVEALYLNSPPGNRVFAADEVVALTDAGVFRPPQIGFSYLVDDEDQRPNDPSDGVPDGRIQIREAVDFELTFKNDSVFRLQDVQVSATTGSDQVDLFDSEGRVTAVEPGARFGHRFRLAVKPRFGDEAIDLRIRVRSADFGTIAEIHREIPVGREVGEPVISLSKQVVATEAVSVFADAEGTRELFRMDEGAVFDVTGQLGDFYKVVIFDGDSFGWVPASAAEDFRPEMETGRRVSELDEEGRLFENIRPLVVIRSPGNNARIDDNRVTVSVEAIDQGGRIAFIAVWVNGERLPGSTARGLAVTGARDGERIRREFDIPLQEGENTIRVVAYNERNEASEEQMLRVHSSGMRNPPELYLLAIGVDDYEDQAWNLRYAASDAQAIARAFTSQEGRLYETVHTRVLTNSDATRSDIIRALNEFIYRADREDVVLVFLAGHGVEDRGTYYFIPSDGDPTRPARAGISQDDLYNQLFANIGASTSKAVVMLDTCQSGYSLARSGRRGIGPDLNALVEELAESEAFFVMSAAQSNETAQERPEWGHGAYTLAILDALENGLAPDLDRDGALSVVELHEYVHDRVLEITDGAQKPTYAGENIDNFPLWAK